MINIPKCVLVMLSVGFLAIGTTPFGTVQSAEVSLPQGAIKLAAREGCKAKCRRRRQSCRSKCIDKHASDTTNISRDQCFRKCNLSRRACERKC